MLPTRTTPFRLVLSVAVAALFAATLASRAYVDFTRVRIRVVKEAVKAAEPQISIPLPDLSSLDGAPSALILRLRGVVDSTAVVAVDGAPLAEVALAAGADMRHDLVFVPQAGTSQEVTITAAGSGWTLAYLEISNIHGQSRGAVDFVIVPRGRVDPSAVPLLVSLLVFGTLALLAPVSSWTTVRPLTLLHRVLATAALLLVTVALVSPLVSPYAVLVSVRTLVACAVLVYGGPLVRSIRPALGVLRRALTPLVRALRPVPEGGVEIAPLPSAREVAMAALAFTAVTLLMLHTQLARMNSVPDLGDPLFSMWRLAWVTHQLASNPARLFDANIFYPDRGTLTYSDSMILPALMQLPLLWLGIHPVTAYNVLFLSAFVLSGVAAYVFGRSIGYGVPAAWTSGFIFAFYSFRFEHYSHLELQMSMWMPMAFLGIHRLVMGGSVRRYVGLTAAALAAQWYSSMYFGLFLSVAAATFGAVLATGDPARRQRLRALAAALALGTLVALPLAIVYARFGEQRGERPVEVIRAYSATPGDYLDSTDRRAIYKSVSVGESHGERQLFPGIAPVALAIAGAWPPLNVTRLALIAAGLVSFDGSLGLNGIWYPVAHTLLFPFQSMRVPARFAMLVGLALALLAGAAVNRWTVRRPRGRGVAAALVITIPLIVDAWPSLTLVPVWRVPPPVYEELRDRRDAVLFQYPTNSVPDGMPENIPYMYFSVWHWKPMINGYSGNSPAWYDAVVPRLAPFPNGETLGLVRELGGTHIAVVCALGTLQAFGVPSGDARCPEVLAALDRDARVRPIRRAEWEGAPAVLYELVK